MAQWLVVASPITALAINCAAYLMLRRVLSLRLDTAILGGLIFGFASIVGMAIASIGYADIDPAESLICQVGTYLALSFCFWVFLNLNITALRVRVMRHLLHVGDGVAVSELLASYSDAERFQRRLQRLTNGGQIELVDGNWRLRSSIILIVARCMETIHAIMGLGSTDGGRTSHRFSL